MEFEIKHREAENKGAFYIEEHGKDIAKIEYSVAPPNKIIASHTEVNPELKGQGIGNKILDSLADYARKNNIKVIALCPFVHAQFKRHQEKYQDIIA